MKSIIATALTILGLSAFGATPTFHNFNTNQFSTNLNQLGIKGGSPLTNVVLRSGSGGGPQMTVTNIQGTNLIVDFVSMSNGTVTIGFSSSPGDLAYGSIRANPGHDGAFTDTSNFEFEFSTPGSYAFGPGVGFGGKGHLQWGVGFGKYWDYGQWGQVDPSVGFLSVGMPRTARVGWSSNGVTYSKFPGFIPVGTHTNGGWKYVWMHDLGNDGVDDWDTNAIDDAGSLYVKPGGAKGWDFRGGIMHERLASTITTTNYALDFGKAYMQDLTVNITNITFSTTNVDGFSTNYEKRVFFIRSAAFTPTLSWPANFCVAGTAVGGALPTNMGSGQILRLELESVGAGHSNKIASATLATDFAWSWDADAQAYFARVGAGVLSLAQSNAVNQLVYNAKANGWWTNCDAIYPFVGGTSNAHAINLKQNAFHITFTDTGVTHDALGITGDGTSGSGNTGFTPSTAAGLYTQNSAHIMVYIGSNTPTDGGYFAGSLHTGFSSRAGLRRNGVALTATGLNDNGQTAPSINMGGDFRGPSITTRTGAAVKAIYTTTGTAPDTTTSVNLPNSAIAFLGRNTGGSVDLWSNSNLRGATIGEGVDATKAAALRADFDAFNASLGRKVP